MHGTDKDVLFAAEAELIKRGANFVKGDPFKEFAVEDQRFITGQNPFSSTKVAQMLVALQFSHIRSILYLCSGNYRFLFLFHINRHLFLFAHRFGNYFSIKSFCHMVYYQNYI